MSGPSPFERIKKPLKSDMNVVPYIDVMLVLLVIFMVTAPMLATGLKVDLPQVATEPVEVSPQAPALVSVRADGQYFLKLADGPEQAMTLAQLRSTLSAAQQRNPQLSVLINGDRAASYGKVVELMGSLQQAGLQQVGLLTEPQPVP
jgi:biopolymer transport protein TolR